ncbi:DUF5958 family protein [Microbispora rosea]|uniref:DUF5958 family protein n=1 Tax=Microbispora rosea TaxID=58117 RepID=UPI003417938A
MQEYAVILNELAQALRPMSWGVTWFEELASEDQFAVLRDLAVSEDDPEVWSYCEGGSSENVPTTTHERFTDWLRGIAAREIPSWRRLTAFYREEQAQHVKDRRLYCYRINPDGTRTEEF